MGELAQWQCHKIVKAGKILRLPVLLGNEKGESLNAYDVRVADVDGVAARIECAASVFARSSPAVGDYIVIYEDGYISWSPARAFEEGYARVTPEPALNPV